MTSADDKRARFAEAADQPTLAEALSFALEQLEYSGNDHVVLWAGKPQETTLGDYIRAALARHDAAPSTPFTDCTVPDCYKRAQYCEDHTEPAPPADERPLLRELREWIERRNDAVDSLVTDARLSAHGVITKIDEFLARPAAAEPKPNEFGVDISDLPKREPKFTFADPDPGDADPVDAWHYDALRDLERMKLQRFHLDEAAAGWRHEREHNEQLRDSNKAMLENIQRLRERANAAERRVAMEQTAYRKMQERAEKAREERDEARALAEKLREEHFREMAIARSDIQALEMERDEARAAGQDGD